MKIVVLNALVVVCSIFLTSCGGERMNENNDLAKEKLRGKVSMIRTTSYYNDSKHASDGYLWKESNWVRNGEEKHYSPAGMLLRTAHSSYISPYTYDEEGKLLNVKSIDSDRGDFVARENKYYYNNVLLMKVDEYIWGKISQSVNYTYDDQKRVAKEVTFDENESCNIEIVYRIYDNDSKEVADDCQLLTIEYYEGSKLIKSLVSDRGNIIQTRYEYSGNKLKKSISQGNDGRSVVTTYGKSGEELTSSDKTPLDSSRYRYNNYTYKYKYDDKGNWTECLCEHEFYDEGLRPRIEYKKTVREITYYED